MGFFFVCNGLDVIKPFNKWCRFLTKKWSPRAFSPPTYVIANLDLAYSHHFKRSQKKYCLQQLMQTKRATYWILSIPTGILFSVQLLNQWPHWSASFFFYNHHCGRQVLQFVPYKTCVFQNTSVTLQLQGGTKILPSSPLRQPPPDGVSSHFPLDQLLPQHPLRNDPIPFLAHEFGRIERVSVQVGQNILGNMVQAFLCERERKG